MMADRSDGLHIVIENVMDDEPYMMARIMERIKIPDIRLCLDVGNASCVGSVQPREWLEVLAPYIGHIHLHNNDGTYDYHGSVFDGKTDMGDFLERAIELCGEDTTFTVESLEGLSSMKWLEERGFI